ncbi:MAG: hypothetical protein ACFFKA_15885 [Candidatus Thorarchaeota archaeon]
MEDLINPTIIKGIVFCAYEKFGPQPIYMFPKPISLGEAGLNNHNKEDAPKYIPSLRDYTQIAIKNLSLLIGDGSILEKGNLNNIKHVAIIPFPDFHYTSFTYYHFGPSAFNDGTK